MKLEICDKSHVHSEHPCRRRATWICICGHTHGVVIYSKFYLNWFCIFRATVGRNLVIPITLTTDFYNSL